MGIVGSASGTVNDIDEGAKPIVDKGALWRSRRDAVS
jgi:hypothetical protein